MYSTPRWGCAAQAPGAQWIAVSQVVPCAPTGVSRRMGHKHVRKHVGPNIEGPEWGRCPGSYAPVDDPKPPEESVAAVAASAATDAPPPFRLFRPSWVK